MIGKSQPPSSFFSLVSNPISIFIEFKASRFELRAPSMDAFHSQHQKHKKRLTQDQVRLLETSFDHGKKLEPERKLHLARELGVPPRQVAIWYQNKRARWKTQNLELDYNVIRVRLEHALIEKRRLERDVIRLQGELEKAHEMLHVLNYANPNPPPIVSTVLSSTSCDEGGSTLENNEEFQFEKLYTSLMGADGSNWV